MGINIIMFNLTLFIIDFIIVWHITATIQSIYVHRAIAHTYIKYNPIIESLFRIWLWLIVAFNWPGWAKHFATHHRKHHRYADLKNDPHSPVHQTLKGLIKAGKREEIEIYMKEKGINILVIQETYINLTYIEQGKNYTFYFSGIIIG